MMEPNNPTVQNPSEAANQPPPTPTPTVQQPVQNPNQNNSTPPATKEQKRFSKTKIILLFIILLIFTLTPVIAFALYQATQNKSEENISEEMSPQEEISNKESMGENNAKNNDTENEVITSKIPTVTNSITATPTPEDNSEENNQKRQTSVTQILNAVGAYKADHKGELPSQITLSAKSISSKGANICSILVGAYIPGLPTDPLSAYKGLVVTSQDCSGDYDTEFTILKDSEDRITVAAPKAENGETISITR